MKKEVGRTRFTLRRALCTEAAVGKCVEMVRRHRGKWPTMKRCSSPRELTIAGTLLSREN